MSRLAVCAVLFAASCLLVAQRAEPLAAQEKKDKNTVAALERQVAALKQDLQIAAQLNNALKADVVQREKQNVVLKQEVSVLKQEVGVLKTTNGRLNSIIKKENIALPAADQTIANLQTTIDGYRGAGLVHVVVLKLKSDSSAGEAQSVIDDTYAQLAKIKTVRGVWAGKPAAKPTPGAATDYTVALVFVFDNADGLKSYLNDPVHTKFADKHLKKWEAPLVYDFEPKKPAAP
jgi:hypothetical protein